ncbi:hypothetical protein MJO29_015404 [Puccinia striiformis f. sp. tritici]|uniref:hypothetical protein n=1 Tax=Puccinia striiformis f. sp. tritici TaxID=168172 RepID=UPI002007E001|nr:hypothetical protein Pst134EA_028984 [Puccinia striiformis f. sp. tritici]KAH9447000.1 hypothetical protein Pst134EA_028984 [Puccinia striiformis f. sp. tritici]KAI7936101.1 hypothetical protein MJO29_015404 [Puccinia striiformis f. sp. tritici]
MESNKQEIKPTVPPSITGLQLLNSLKKFEPFSTGHRQIDCQLWSRPLKRNRSDTPTLSYPPLTGLSRRQHLQIDGPPGSGKTKLVIGLALRARTASLIRHGGSEQIEVLLIDSDASLHPTLIQRSAKALVESCYQDRDDSKLVERICDGCHLVRITTTPELGFFFKHLPVWLKSHPKVKLVILDSITAHTRYVSMSLSQRKTIAKIIKEGLTSAASQYDCAIVVTSQLATKSVTNQGTYTNLKTLTPPDFGPNFWSSSSSSKDESSSSSTTKTNRIGSLSFKLSRICLMFNSDCTRRAIVLENDKIIQPRHTILYEIDEIGIYDPTTPKPTESDQSR